MVVHLVLETTTEPIHKGLRETVSSRNVTGGGDLKLPEIGSGIGIVGGHTVVTQTKDNGQKESTRACHDHEEGNRFSDSKGSVPRGDSKGPGVVQKNADTFQNGVLKSLQLHFLSSIFRSSSQAKGHLEGFVHPRETSQEKNRKVEERLVANKESDRRRVLSFVEFPIGLGLLQTPSQERHGIHIRITILAEGGRVVQVGNSVVSIVLVLPPLHRVTLHEVTPEDTSPVSILSLAEDLVVQEIVSQPPRLLEEETNQQSTTHVNHCVVRVVNSGHTSSPQTHVGQALVHVKEFVGLVHAHQDKLGSQVTVSLFKSELLFVLGHGAGHHISNVKLLHQILGSSRMEGSKDIRHIISRVCEDHTATRVLVPVGDIVDLIVVDNPSIIGGHVLLDLVPSDLLDTGLLWYGVSSFSHGWILRCCVLRDCSAQLGGK
mmetsp:Transcript_30607/g.63925  ORF Transcript_30607/g.63925 Transcript_30607/m.63925 type:complete len:432 (-) Transcript_30607:180-1475(-)